MHQRELFYVLHPDPMWVFDFETLQFLDVNEAAVEVYGYSREDFLGMTIGDIRPQEDVPRLLADIGAARQGQRQAGIWRHRKKSGEILFVRVEARTIEWNGRPARLVSVRDMTRAVQAEQERETLLAQEASLRKEAEATAAQLAEQNANLRRAQRLIRIGTWKYEMPSGHLTWSPEVLEMYGVSPDAFAGTFDAYVALVHPEDREAMAENFARFEKSGQVIFDFAHRIVRPDGRVIHVRGTAELAETPTGKVLAGVVQDQSEQYAADALARASEERYQMVSRSTHDVVWDYDLIHNRITWNENFRVIAGDPAAPLSDASSSWIDRLHPDDRSRVLDGFFGAAADGAKDWSDEYRFLRDDGNVRYVFDRGFVSRDETGRALRIVGSMVDITDRKLAEARLLQAEKLEALGQITGGVAHDFNNLLMIITGNAETLLDRITDPRERRLLELVFSAAERGKDLTGRLLAFARRMPLKQVPLDLNEMVARSAELLRRAFRANIRIETDLDPAGAIIQTDLAQLELVLFNLGVNARDAMRDGGVLTVRTEAIQSDGARQIALTISDTGEGMDRETLRRCLDPFFTTKQVGKGVGLGLSMAFGFMEQLGGKLQIASEPGKGTQVTLLFPAADRRTESAPAAPAELTMGQGEQILLVEDEPGVREHVEAVLVSLGYQVTSHSNPDDAIAYLREGGGADLILTDLIMPGTADVRELARVARERIADVEVLYSSGYPREMVERDGRLSMDIELLAKPYRKAELAERLRTLLDRQAAARKVARQDGA